MVKQEQNDILRMYLEIEIVKSFPGDFVKLIEVDKQSQEICHIDVQPFKKLVRNSAIETSWTLFIKK